MNFAEPSPKARPRAANRTASTGPEPAQGPAFWPDGRIPATGIETGKRASPWEPAIRLRVIAGRREPGRTGHTSAPAISADGHRIVSASEDGAALIWDVARIIGQRTAATEPRGSTIRSI
jgi:hypothetical protein